jgi:hypothetical protein
MWENRGIKFTFLIQTKASFSFLLVMFSGQKYKYYEEHTRPLEH